MFSPRDRVFMISRCDEKGSSLHGKRSKIIRKDLADLNTIKLFWNAKFDCPMLIKEGYKIQGPIECLMIMAQMVLPEEPSHVLKYFARKYNDTKYEEEILLKKAQGVGKKKKMIWELPTHIVGPYALADAQHTFDLRWGLRNKMRELDEIKGVDMTSLYKQEMRIMKITSRMESRGLLVDQDHTRALLKEVSKEMKSLKKKLTDHTGNPDFNPNSPKQVIDVIYTDDTYCTRFTSNANPSTDRIALLQLNTPLARNIARYREVGKSGNTYLKNILKGVDEEGIFRASFNQARAITGRFSSSGYGGMKFNLQNMPRSDQRKGILGKIRECFIVRKGYRFFFIDMDQIEMRLGAHFTQEKHMIRAILKGEDLHGATARKMFKVKPGSKKWKLLRYLAKTLNFLVWYGGGANKLQDTIYDQTEGELHISLEDCSDYLVNYWDKHPMLQKLFDDVALTVSEIGGIVNPYGRFCPVPIHKSYVGVNYLIQGTAADFLKKVMLRCADILRRKRSRMLMTIHDELVFEIHYSEKKLVRALRDAMEDHDTFSVPLTASVEMATKNWGHKVKIAL